MVSWQCSTVAFQRCQVQMSVNKPPNLPDNFHNFSRSLQTDAGIALRLGHSNFISIPLHFITCQSLHHCQYRLEYSIKIYKQLMCPHHKYKIQLSVDSYHYGLFLKFSYGSPLQLFPLHSISECGALTGENRALREKPVPVTIFPP